MVKTTIGQYEYQINLLNLFDHSDFGEKYTRIISSGLTKDDHPKVARAQELKGSDKPEDIAERVRLNNEVGLSCSANLSSEKLEELKTMKMTAIVEGQLSAKRVGEEHSKPVYIKEVFNKHFRDHASPKDMREVLEWALMQNVSGFLGE